VADLTPRQRRFCEEYVVDLNGAGAARRAGYAKNSAKVEGVRLLANANVQAEVERLMAARSKRTQITADAVVSELGKLAFSNMLDYITIQDDGSYIVDFSMVDRDKGAAMQEVTTETYTEGRGEDATPVKRMKFKMADKRGSLELLGRHLGIFNDKLGLHGVDGKPPARFVLDLTE
jgi:phage terminase small subunit